MRTLQRLIKELRLSGQVFSSGSGRATKYKLSKDKAIIAEMQEIDLLPLSNQGRQIHRLVSQPLQKRNPVSYNSNFLKSYQPNVTSYLTVAEKEKLAGLGVTSN